HGDAPAGDPSRRRPRRCAEPQPGGLHHRADPAPAHHGHRPLAGLRHRRQGPRGHRGGDHPRGELGRKPQGRPRTRRVRGPELPDRPRLHRDDRSHRPRAAGLRPRRRRRSGGCGSRVPRPPGRRDRRGGRLSGAAHPDDAAGAVTAGAALEGWPADLLPPPFAAGKHPGLLDVIPPLLERPEPGPDLVVLLDGVGADLLAEHRALTPTLRRLESEITRVRTVAPSTTASAMVSLHTGAPPLRHGVLGYLTRDPRSGRSLNQLTGSPGTDPREWMPLPTPVESGTRRAVQVAPAKHEGSHLSGVAFRGWEFLGHGRGDRVQAVRTALHRAGPDGLVHLHVDDVDHAGHRHGVDSEPWRTALAEVDALVGALLRRLPRGTRIHLTADHGMVDTSPQHTIDLAAHPQLLRLVDEAAGEARALALH